MFDMKAAERVFNGIKDADAGSGGARGPRIKAEGRHRCEITKVHLIESKNPKTRGKTYYVAHFIVHQTTAGQEELGDQRVLVGKEYTWSNDLTNEFFGLANAKQFVAAVAGTDPRSEDAQEIGERDMLESLGYDPDKPNAEPGASPLVGELVTLETEKRKTQSGFDFMVHQWSPAD